MAIPIPHRPSGVLIGDSEAVVTIDAFVDIQCPHSKTVWPILMAVMDKYKCAPVSLRTHLITLSNHRQAWEVSLGLFAYADGDAGKFYQFATYLYQNQSQYYNGEFQNKTHQDLKNLVADFAMNFGNNDNLSKENVDRKAFVKRVQDDDIYTLARTPIRYAATRAVWATPTLFINNADDVPVNHKSDIDAWSAVLEPLLK